MSRRDGENPNTHDATAAYTRHHSGWPFTEGNLIGEFIELPRAEHEALLAVETMMREALDAGLPLADVFVRVAKSHLAALDEVRRG